MLDALSAAPSASAATAAAATTAAVFPSPLRFVTSVAATAQARLAAAIGRGDAPDVERVHNQLIASGASARGIGTNVFAVNTFRLGVF